MSGHSKWSTIKRKKGAADAKRGKIFSKIAKEIMVCARNGGGDPSGNIALRTLIQKAKSANMPHDNIDRAIKKGTGELDGGALEEVTYEGYAPGGVAVIVMCLTDNRNRSAAEVRHLFTKYNGSLSAQGSVSRLFERKGQILVLKDGVDEDKLLEAALESGADDVAEEDEGFSITTTPAEFMNVVDALEAAGIAMESSEVTMVAETDVPVSDRQQAGTLLKFVEDLEDLDDVQDVYSNFDIDEAVMAEIEGA